MIGSRLSDDRASRGRGYGAARNRGRYSGHKRGGGARPQSTVQTSTVVGTAAYRKSPQT